MGASEIQSERRYDIDWLRVLAFALLIFYHTGMLFVSWDWHIKDPVQSKNLEYVMLFVNQWRLPLLFLISGIGMSFALKKRSLIQFAAERSNRLLIPLIAGILIIVPPQVYVERLQSDAFDGNYFQFFPNFFNGIYPNGNFSWHHLWFIVYLFVFSVISIPLVSFFKSEVGQKSIDSFSKIVSHPVGLLSLFLPVAFSEVLLRPSWPSTHNLISDWANFSSYFLIFMLGFLISTKSRVWNTITNYRRIWLYIGLILFGLMMVYFRLHYSTMNAGDFILYRTVKAANSWVWILTCLGFSKVYLNKKSSLIDAANKAVYPFYIVHQTLIVIFGYWLMNWNPGVPIKFITIAFLTFSGTWVLYWGLINRFKIIGILFGLKGDRFASQKKESRVFRQKVRA